MKKFLQKIIGDNELKTSFTYHVNNIPGLPKFYTIEIDFIGRPHEVLERLAPILRDEFQNYLAGTPDSEAFDIHGSTEEGEGVLKAAKINKDKVSVTVTCRPGNLNKYIADADTVKFARAFISKTKV